jgi:hypothetical protein
VLHGFALVDFQCSGPLNDSHIGRATDVQKKAVSVYGRLLYASRPTNAPGRSGVPIAGSISSASSWRTRPSPLRASAHRPDFVPIGPVGPSGQEKAPAENRGSVDHKEKDQSDGSEPTPERNPVLPHWGHPVARASLARLLFASQKILAGPSGQPTHNSTADGSDIDNPPAILVRAVLEDEQAGHQRGRRQPRPDPVEEVS